jgi:RNA polymerase sigma factor (sigma-70 family)
VQDQRQRFEQTVVPHQPAAYNLARWLTGSDQDAQDVVQEALLRAFRFFGGFAGENARAWLLTIVRNTAYNLLGKRKPDLSLQDDPGECTQDGPEEQCLARVELEEMRRCLRALPLEYREPLLLREMEGLSYKEIASALELPIGTVMSRLARGRERLRQSLLKGASHGLH